MPKKEVLERWNVDKSAELYGVANWSNGYFEVTDKGEVASKCVGSRINLMDIVSGLNDRGTQMPVLLRFEEILDSQVRRLNESFAKAIAEYGYKNVYRGVFPIKVNQQQHVIEEITRFGAKYHHGLEAGSKAELIAAISMVKSPEACLICNGYKDEEFVDLALYARKLGLQCFLVIEREGELPLILERAEALKVEPLIGLRVKLSSRAGGHWVESGGDRSVYGLNNVQVLKIVDTLKKEGKLDCLRLLHYHLGSQVPNIRDIRAAAAEACHVYAGLCGEGAPMGYLDFGGGLAVDYDGSHTNYTHSKNYSLDEYCADIVESIVNTLGEDGPPHPVIITESGRATVAYSSVLLFNILDRSYFERIKLPSQLPDDTNEYIKNLLEVSKSLSTKNLQESYHDAMYYRDELREAFRHGAATLRERALGESIFWDIMKKIAEELKSLKYVPDEFEKLEVALADIYYGNFSVFQSLPDAWAIDQLFPIMPIHRLCERPTIQAILADITCDCDGKIDRFVDLHDVRHTLPLHELNDGEEYYLGVFLIGAYQETLGDLHNLLGDTNVVNVKSLGDGKFQFVDEIRGDSVEDVLSYLEYDCKGIAARIRELAEKAISNDTITAKERRRIMEVFEAGLRGYTYFEREM